MISMITTIVLVVYAVAIIPAIYFTYHMYNDGVKVNSTSKVLSIIYTFISIWLIIPFFYLKKRS